MRANLRWTNRFFHAPAIKDEAPASIVSLFIGRFGSATVLRRRLRNVYCGFRFSVHKTVIYF